MQSENAFCKNTPPRLSGPTTRRDVVVAAVPVAALNERFLIVDEAVSANNGPEKYARPVVVAFVEVALTDKRLVTVELAPFTKNPPP